MKTEIEIEIGRNKDRQTERERERERESFFGIAKRSGPENAEEPRKFPTHQVQTLIGKKSNKKQYNILPKNIMTMLEQIIRHLESLLYNTKTSLLRTILKGEISVSSFK